MASLKYLDVSQHEKAVFAAAESAIGNIRQTAAAVLEDVRQAAKALAELPERSEDLLVAASHVWAREVDIADPIPPIGDNQFRYPVTVSFDGRQAVEVRSGQMWGASADRVLPGRYRAIVVLLPLEKSNP